MNIHEVRDFVANLSDNPGKIDVSIVLPYFQQLLSEINQHTSKTVNVVDFHKMEDLVKQLKERIKQLKERIQYLEGYIGHGNLNYIAECAKLREALKPVAQEISNTGCYYLLQILKLQQRVELESRCTYREADYYHSEGSEEDLGCHEVYEGG